MKQIALTITCIAAALAFTACDPSRGKTRPQPAPTGGGGLRTPETDPGEKKPKEDKPKIQDPDAGVPDAGTDKPAPVIPDKPAPPVTGNVEHGKKAEGKPGFITSPYTGDGRLIDVRNLPPGTEIECPYTHRPLLVP